jgi:hypothetical protein
MFELDFAKKDIRVKKYDNPTLIPHNLQPVGCYHLFLSFIGVCFILGIVLSLFFNHENVGYQLLIKLFKSFFTKVIVT